MDIRAALLEAHSRSQSDKIIKFIGRDPFKLQQLVQLFLEDSYKVVQRAAWPLSDICLQYPDMAKPYLPALLQKLQQPGIHVAVKRNVMRLFQVVDLPETIHEPLMNHAFDYLANRSEAIAVRACSMTVLGRLADYYPDIRPELRLVLADILQNEQAAGLRSRARTELDKL